MQRPCQGRTERTAAQSNVGIIIKETPKSRQGDAVKWHIGAAKLNQAWWSPHFRLSAEGGGAQDSEYTVEGSFNVRSLPCKSVVELLGHCASLPDFILTRLLGKMEAGEPP